jgi:ABC-type lipoprotein release transport system permease subunit
MERILGEDPWSGAFITLTNDQPLSTASAGVAERTESAFWFTRPDRAGVRSLRDVRELPSVLLVLLGMMAAAALVHRLVMGSRAARREQAVLRSLGFTGRQFAQAGAAQGAAVSVLALIGAIPFGLLCATVGWRRIAEYLRVVPSPAVPVTLVVGVAILAVALAVIAGVALSRRARRARPGVVLRTE